METGSAIREDAIAVQREEIEELQGEVARLTNLLASTENRLVLEQSTSNGLRTDMETMMDVIRLLAGQLTNGLAAPRKARKDARRMLERRGITPPSTLGSSRERKSKYH